MICSNITLLSDNWHLSNIHFSTIAIYYVYTHEGKFKNPDLLTIFPSEMSLKVC